MSIQEPNTLTRVRALHLLQSALPDPFVIAQAFADNPRLVVVTQEAGGTADKPRIPFVCDLEDVRHIDLLTLIEEEDWSF